MERKLDIEHEACKGDSVCSREQKDVHSSEARRTQLSEESGLLYNRIPAVPWEIKDVALAAALAVPLGVGGSFALSFVLMQMSLVEDRTLALIIGSALLPIALFASAWLFGARRYRVSSELLGFRRTSLTSAVWLPAVALAVGISITAMYALIVDTLGIEILIPNQGLEEISGQEGIGQVLTFAVVAVLSPLGEEVFFRGFLLAALLPTLGALRGSLVSSAIFAAAHLNVGTLLPIFVMGMALAWLYMRTGSILPPFAAHMVQNLLALTFLELDFDATAGLL